MHARKWLLGLVAGGTTAVMAAAGCGNSSSSNPPADSGSGQMTEAAAETGSADSAVDTGVEAAPCVPDADITMLMVPDAGIGDSGATVPACFACIQSLCGTQLSACSGDCACNSAVQQFAGCLGMASQTVMGCATQLVGASGATGLPLVLCVAGSAAPGGTGAGCLAQCGQGGLLMMEGGTDGATEGSTGDAGGGEAGADAAAE